MPTRLWVGVIWMNVCLVLSRGRPAAIGDRRTRASETTARREKPVTLAHDSKSDLQKQGVIARLAGAGRAGVF